jgi:hypothetical protein
VALKLGDEFKVSKRLRALNQESINILAPVLGLHLGCCEPCDKEHSREVDTAAGDGWSLVIDVTDMSLSLCFEVGRVDFVHGTHCKE